ncbi:pyridoxal 5'-phosphate synthase glutaminase subunit PdxT [Commensalibacter melissae]|uniref:pyridoxal 5'-phosphate synthase glutaminase subunit PdxT n=1 Tax=Commensalibacter melissae TaxID=2070537 RepID=UPI0012D8EFAD|nr:pyridoxal 5'-phosphate synthase glutaminase subunit PdxT [Commensalibacter melissae]MUG08769.1 pyridoxal 5'-phosphate synthase glutaminase subunit PdxT [Commensalibacter melissae]
MHKKIGVLALQGAVSEHIAQLQGLGALGIEIKTAEDLKRVKGLIIPGGESTAISRLIQEVGLYEPIRDFARKNPVFGTCAGLILCGSSITDGGEKLKPLNLIDIAVTRNGFGRQIDSFEVDLDIGNIGKNIPSVFIRAPYIASVGEDVNVLAEYDKKIVMAEQGNILVCSFHPELTENNQIMDYFISKIES